MNTTSYISNMANGGEHDIYFVRSGNSNLVKIGCCQAGTYRKRIFDLQIGNPETMDLMGVIAGCNKSFEKEIHKIFQGDRFRGEWYRLTDKLQAFIKENCGNTRMIPSARINSNQTRELILIHLFDIECAHRAPPTHRELGKKFGWTSSRSAVYHLQTLEAQGYLTLERHISRGIILTEAGRRHARQLQKPAPEPTPAEAA